MTGVQTCALPICVRIYDTYNETRATVTITLSRKLGDFWSVGVTGAYTWVELSEFDPDAAIEVYDDRGPTTLFSGSFFVKRTDVDRPLRPSRGSNSELTVTQYMTADGTDPFTMFRGEYTQFFTVTEDLLGNRTILKLANILGYIAGDAPTYERFYLGGRSFRGFDFRTISPKATGAVKNAGDPIEVLLRMLKVPVLRISMSAVIHPRK